MGTQKLDPTGRVTRDGVAASAPGTPIVPAVGPVARQDLVVREVDGEFVVYDSHARRAHRLNRAAAQVWSLCDGTRSTTDLAASLAKDGVEDAPSVVDQAVSQFQRAGLLESPASRRFATARANRRTFVRWGTAAVAGGAIPLVISVAAPHAVHAVTNACFELQDCTGADIECERPGFPNSSLCKCCNNPNDFLFHKCITKASGQNLCVTGPVAPLRAPSTPGPSTSSTQPLPTATPRFGQGETQGGTPGLPTAPLVTPSSRPRTR
jgi:Coenzyme PQQ synthesis protein D (PqqD)